MKLDLNKKVVIVTGASRGIGASIAKALGANGASVVVNYHSNKEKAEEVLREITKLGGEGLIYRADVRNTKEVNSMVETTVKRFGEINVLINNANISFPIKPFIELSWQEISNKLTGELHALYNCSQAVLKEMMLRKNGKLIFVSSGLSRRPGYGFAAHSAAKAAVDSIAKVMAMELGPMGITVNVIGPGLVKTDATAGQPKEMQDKIASFTPLRRIGMPDDIAGVALFLASSLSKYLTGEYIPVNGGSFMI